MSKRIFFFLKLTFLNNSRERKTNVNTSVVYKKFNTEDKELRWLYFFLWPLYIIFGMSTPYLRSNVVELFVSDCVCKCITFIFLQLKCCNQSVIIIPFTNNTFRASFKTHFCYGIYQFVMCTLKVHISQYSVKCITYFKI